MTKDFRSDNVLGCAPEILDAIGRANRGTMTSYGGDEITARVRARCCELFETDVDVFPVLTGIAANAIAIGSMTPAGGAIVCHSEAHIELEEDRAAELFSGGKLAPLPGANGKLDPRSITAGATLSITNATESGTVYSVDEMRALGDAAKRLGMRVHVDGARFSNAVASLSCSPADLSWRAGADILTFGATKNGAFGAEVIVVFRKELAKAVAALRHRSGHEMSKMRLLSAQLEEYLTDDLWLRNARNANAMAARLRDGLEPHVEILRPVEANIVFIRLPPERLAALRADGFQFLDWILFGENVVRIVTGFSTTADDVDALVSAVARGTA